MPINFKAKAIDILIVLLNNHTFLDPFLYLGPQAPKPKSCKLQDDFQVVLGCCNASDSWQFQLSPTACPVAACWTRTCIWEKSNGSQGELNRFEISMGISWHSKSFFDIFNPMKRFNIPTPHRLYQSPCWATNGESLSFYLQRHPVKLRLDFFLHFESCEITKEVLFLIANLLPLNFKVFFCRILNLHLDEVRSFHRKTPRIPVTTRGFLHYLGRESQTKPLFAAPTGWGVDGRFKSMINLWKVSLGKVSLGWCVCKCVCLIMKGRISKTFEHVSFSKIEQFHKVQSALTLRRCYMTYPNV